MNPWYESLAGIMNQACLTRSKKCDIFIFEPQIKIQFITIWKWIWLWTTFLIQFSTKTLISFNFLFLVLEVVKHIFYDKRTCLKIIQELTGSASGFYTLQSVIFEVNFGRQSFDHRAGRRDKLSLLGRGQPILEHSRMWRVYEVYPRTPSFRPLCTVGPYPIRSK